MKTSRELFEEWWDYPSDAIKYKAMAWEGWQAAIAAIREHGKAGELPEGQSFYRLPEG